MKSIKLYRDRSDSPLPSKKMIESETSVLFLSCTKNDDQCAEKRCKKLATLRYLGKPLCQKHWQAFCDKQDKEEMDRREKDDY